MCTDCKCREIVINTIMRQYIDSLNRFNYGPTRLTTDQIHTKMDDKRRELESLTSELLLEEYETVMFAAGMAAYQESMYM